VKAADTLTYDANFNVTGSTGAKTTQTYRFQDSFGHCYDRTLTAADHVLTNVSGGYVSEITTRNGRINLVGRKGVRCNNRTPFRSRVCIAHRLRYKYPSVEVKKYLRRNAPSLALSIGGAVFARQSMRARRYSKTREDVCRSDITAVDATNRKRRP
jgi:hypothetical protein